MRGSQAAANEVPGPKRPSYAGEVVEVLEWLAGRSSVRHGRRIVLAQETPPSTVLLRNGHGRSAPVPVLPSGPTLPGRTLDGGSRTTGLKSRGREGSRDPHRLRGHSRQTQSHFSAQADVHSDGEVEGDSEGQAQGDVLVFDVNYLCRQN